MIYTCSHTGRRDAASTGEIHQVAQRGKSLRVDIHCHYHNYAIDKLAEGLDKSSVVRNPFINPETLRINAEQEEAIMPLMADVDARLAEMDKMGVDIQAVSPATEHYFYWTPPEVGRDLARSVNDGMAELVAQRPDRLVGLGTLPLQHPEFAVAELERIVGELGLRGVEICSNVNGVTLSDRSLGLEPVFAKLEELNVLAFMHPRPFSGGKRFAEYHMNNIIGQPLDSTVAVTHLIFDGVLERHPGLKLCIAHAGGYLPFYPGRMDHAYHARAECKVLPKPPSAYLKRLYFDAMTFDPDMLGWLIARYGADRVLLGTDYPYDMGIWNPNELIDAVQSLSEAERDLVKGGNAMQLLGITTPQAAAA
jgi:aminocarboxymuconate-semialdehyde decarboxylase